MAELLTAKDKLPQVEAQIRAAEMEYYVLSIRAKFAPETPPLKATDAQKVAYINLKNESDAAAVQILMWERKLSILRPIYEKLLSEVLDLKEA